MKNRINNILIGLLWLLAIALGATFWFNTKYGFNIFSIPHWQYLAYMQVSNQPVRSSFYISLVIIVVIAVLGLYQLLQPRIRKIILPIFDTSTHNKPTIQQPTPIPQQPENTDTDTNKPDEQQTNTISTPVALRPPRLNIPISSRTTTPIPHVPLTQSATPTPQHFNPEQEYADIREIFTSAGFVYKGAPRIKSVQTSVIAIGTNEILWIGATGVSTNDMQRAVDTLNGVFIDTLEGIEINVKAFIINATDDSDDTSIMHFSSVEELRTFINKHPNIPPTEDEIENFDAYSGYIGTVVDYIG